MWGRTLWRGLTNWERRWLRWWQSRRDVKIRDATSKVAIKPSSHGATDALAPPRRPRSWTLAAAHRLAPDSSSAAESLTPRRTLARSEPVRASRVAPRSRCDAIPRRPARGGVTVSPVGRQTVVWTVTAVMTSVPESTGVSPSSVHGERLARPSRVCGRPLKGRNGAGSERAVDGAACLTDLLTDVSAARLGVPYRSGWRFLARPRNVSSIARLPCLHTGGGQFVDEPKPQTRAQQFGGGRF